MATSSDATDAAQALAEVEGTLRRWSVEGPPSMFRASAGALATKLQGASNASHGAAAEAEAAKAQASADADKLSALHRRNELLQMSTEDVSSRSRMLREELGRREAIEKEREVQEALDRQAEREQAHEQQAMLREEIEALGPYRVEAAKLRQQEAALCAQLVSVLSPVSVMCRTRPMRSFKDQGADMRNALTTEGGEITVEEARGRQRKFRVDRVLDEHAAEEDVYTASAPWVENVALGGSSCVFAYGATGAGKTHTLLGEGRASGSPGLAHGAIRRLIEGQGGGEVHISMLEVYCDQIRDLLADPATTAAPSGEVTAGPPILQCSRRDGQGRMVLDNVEVVASTFVKAGAILRSGYKNRATEGTRCNDRSSRSHVVLTVQTAGAGRLVLVDLAGSENVQRSGADEGGKLLTEAKAINKSLSALANVVEAIAKQQAFVPYRDTRLTMLLEGALCGSKVLFMVNVSPLVSDAIDSGHSLQFASRVQAIDFGAQRLRQDQEDRLKASQQRSQQESRQLQAEVEKLKKERDDALKACQDAKQQAIRDQQKRQATPPKVSDEHEMKRLRQEVAQLTDELHKRDSAAAKVQMPFQATRLPPRTQQRGRTPTPPVRQTSPTGGHHFATKAQGQLPMQNLGAAAPVVPVDSQTNNRTPLGDVTNSELEIQPSTEKAGKGLLNGLAAPTEQLLQPDSPTKLVAKADALASPALRSPSVRDTGDSADAAAGWHGPVEPVMLHSPSARVPPRSPRPSPRQTLGMHEERPKYNLYAGVSVKSILRRRPTDWSARGKVRLEAPLNASDECATPRASDERRCHFAEEVPVPRSPPKWYMDHLESLRPPTPNAEAAAGVDVVLAPVRSGSGTPRQITPPPRTRQATRANQGQMRSTNLPRWQ